MAVTSDPFVGGVSSNHPANDLIATISEVWTDMVNEKTFNDTVLANFCTDLSAYAQNGGAVFHVPDLYTNSLTVSTQSTQGAEVTTASPAQNNTVLSVTTHKYVAFIIGDLDMGQIASNYNINELYVNEARRLLTEALEQDLAALWSSLTTNITITDTATLLSDAEIRAGLYTMENGKYHLDECAFFFHPYVYWEQLHGITKYYQQYSYGPSTEPGAVRTGNFGTAGYALNFKGFLYGVPCYTTTNIVSSLLTYRNLLLHKRAFGFAIQTKGGARVRVQIENAVRNLGTLAVIDIVYGVAVLRDAAAVLLQATTAFINS